MLIDTSMHKINPITKIQSVVLKNLLDTRYRQRNKRKEKKYDRKKYNAVHAYHEMLKYFRNNNYGD